MSKLDEKRLFGSFIPGLKRMRPAVHTKLKKSTRAAIARRKNEKKRLAEMWEEELAARAL